MPLTGSGIPQGGLVQTAGGTEPIPISAAGTLAAGAVGTAISAGLNTDFAKVVTALVVKDTIETLRHKAIFAQSGNEYHRATHVPGTNQFVYTGFADLGPAVELLEGIPPETQKMLFDTFSFTGKQIGKTTAITDLAEVFSPFDLYVKASEKLAWNVVDYIETTLAALLNSAATITLATANASYSEDILEIVTFMKRRDVPMFPDGTYHAFITPETAAKIMAGTGTQGWTEIMKYADPTKILNGEVGTFRGIRFMETNRLDDGQGANVGNVVVFGPGAYVCGDYQTVQAYRVARGGDHADPLAQRAVMGWKGMMGFRLVNFAGAPVGYEMGPAGNTAGNRIYKATITGV